MSEDSTLDRRLPALRKRRSAGIYVAYSIAGALLLGAGALSLGHLTAYRPAARTLPPTDSQAAPAAAPAARPVVLAQAQSAAPEPAPAQPPSGSQPSGLRPTVTVKMPVPRDEPASAPPAAAATPPVAAAPVAPPPAAPDPAPATPGIAAADPAPVNLIAANGLPAPPPEKPPAPMPTSPPPSVAAAAPDDQAPVNLIAANGLPAPPPEKPPAPPRRMGMCPAGTDPADLIENDPAGKLPRIAGNGCMPWLAYAAEFDRLDRERPRLGMAVVGIGPNEALTQRAIETLPPGLTLVFAPETANLERWIHRARARGLEALLLVPVQNPQGITERGMATLQKGLAPDENMRRLRAVLGRASGYVGVALQPSPVLEDVATIRPLLGEIRDRGLLVLEFERWNGKSLIHALSREMGIPYSTDIDSPIAWIDRVTPGGRETTARDVDGRLAELEKYVASARFGLGWTLPRPLSIERVAAWAPGARTRGIMLAPVTGVTECGESCQKRLPRAAQPPDTPPVR